MDTKRRVVFIAQRLSDFEGESEFYGHCEVEDRGATTMIEGPGWQTADEAVAWGRKVAPTVIIRIGPRPGQQHYSAGEVFPDSSQAPAGGILPWPPDSAPDP